MRRTTVGEVMKREVVTAQPNTPFARLVAMLAEHHISGLPITHPAGTRVLGVVSETDLLAKERFKSPDLAMVDSPLARQAREKAEGIIAADLMSTPAITVTPETTVVEAARLLAYRSFNRLPVVDRHGRLLGIVTRSDLLRVFLRKDEETRTEVLEVLQRYLWLDTSLLRVEVHDGVVHLSGRLDLRSRVATAVLLVSAIEGVSRVIEDLAYEEDDTGRHARPPEAGHPA